MTFMDKLRISLQKFMTGRRGADELSLALLIVGVVLSVLSGLFRLNVLYILSVLLYGYAMFRMFSKNLDRRYAENAAFVRLWQGKMSIVRQFFNRMKNMRKYKYFKCPECKQLLRLPRGVGEVTVTCGKCHQAFKQKA